MLSRVQIYLLLAAAIVAEVVATTALARSAGLTKHLPSLVAVVGYAFAFWLLSFALEVIPTGVVDAIWSGLGIVLVTAWAWSGQSLDPQVMLGVRLINAGVVVVTVLNVLGPLKLRRRGEVHDPASTGLGVGTGLGCLHFIGWLTSPCWLFGGDWLR